MQVEGQPAVLHDPLSDKVGHAVPPFRGAVVMVRDRDRVPPPQATEQVPQELHALTTQSTGQQAVMHDPSSDKVGHAVPPF